VHTFVIQMNDLLVVNRKYWTKTEKNAPAGQCTKLTGCRRVSCR